MVGQAFGCGLVMYEDPKVWSFFEKEDARMLDNNIAIRAAESSAHQCQFFFIGKRMIQGPSTAKHSVTKFSKYEGSRLLHFLNPILDEIRENQGRDELIPFFKKMEDGEHRAFEEPTKDNRLGFWAKPDLKLSTSNVRMAFNSIVGEYELHIVNPVSAEISEKHKGWPGPSVNLRESAMHRLREFIMREAARGFDETDYVPVSQNSLF